MKVRQYKTILEDDGRCILIEENSFDYDAGPIMSQPREIYRMLCNLFQHNRQTEEYIYLICLDTKCKFLGIMELVHGTVFAALCSAREIFQKALLCNASGIVLAHNHPSGDVRPSDEDIAMFKTVKEASKIIGIKLLDNLVIGDTYFSFSENGMV